MDKNPPIEFSEDKLLSKYETIHKLLTFHRFFIVYHRIFHFKGYFFHLYGHFFTVYYRSIRHLTNIHHLSFFFYHYGCILLASSSYK